MDSWCVGIIPLPLFVLAGPLLIAVDCLGKLPSDIVVMAATLAFFGFACGEFGKRPPIVGKLGAAGDLRDVHPFGAGLLRPAAGCGGGVDHQIPTNPPIFSISTSAALLSAVSASMNRTVLIQGFLRIFFPMLCGEIVGMIVGA